MASLSDTSATTHQPDWDWRLTAHGRSMDALNKGVASPTNTSGDARISLSIAAAPGFTSSTFLPAAVGCETNTASSFDPAGSIT